MKLNINEVILAMDTKNMTALEIAERAGCTQSYASAVCKQLNKQFQKNKRTAGTAEGHIQKGIKEWGYKAYAQAFIDIANNKSINAKCTITDEPCSRAKCPLYEQAKHMCKAGHMNTKSYKIIEQS